MPRCRSFLQALMCMWPKPEFRPSLSFASYENSPSILVSRLASVSLPALRRGLSPAITTTALWTSAPPRRLNAR